MRCSKDVVVRWRKRCGRGVVVRKAVRGRDYEKGEQ